MENIIVIVLVAVIVALAVLYIIKSKKSGKKCIGCPYACNCSKDSCNKK